MSAPTTDQIVDVARSRATEWNVSGLACRECGKGYPIAPEFVCDECFGPLGVAYDYDHLKGVVSRTEIERGPSSIWRYYRLLPTPTAQRVDIGAGWTPLRAAPRLAAELGIRRLWLKDDTQNPTYSFKDRVVSVALSAAKTFGFDVVSCASTGNLANSVAAHASACGLRSVIFIPHDLERAKVATTAVYGGTVVAVNGSYDDVNRLCVELAASRPWGFVNVNLRPFYAEGSKTVGFEIVEQLGWRYPDAVVIPVASGALLTKVARGFEESHLVGLTEEPPRSAIHGAQAAGCSPVAAAFAAGSESVAPVRPQTIARSLAIGNPADGYYALKTARASGGSISAIREEDIVDSIKLLARTEGMFTETAGGVTIGVLEQLVRRGVIGPNDETVAVITGVGLKTLELVEDSVRVHEIEARLEAAERLLKEV